MKFALDTALPNIGNHDQQFLDLCYAKLAFLLILMKDVASFFDKTIVQTRIKENGIDLKNNRKSRMLEVMTL